MEKRTKLIATILILSMILIPISVVAIPITLEDEVSIRSIDQNSYYDSQPYIWGDYVVWRRGVNQNENKYIELREASWIMVHNLKTQESYNITPALEFLYGTIYHHAQSPHMWGEKVIYEAQTGGNSTDVALFMYDIKTKETKQIPIPISKPDGRLHRIFGDWIVYTNRENNKRQAHLYNYVTGVNRVLIGPTDEYSVYGLEMHSTNIVFTLINQTGMNYDIWLYDILYSQFNKLFVNQTNQTMATSIYQNQIGITEYKNGNWTVSVYDYTTNNITFTDVGFGILVKYGITYHQAGNIVLIEPNEEPYIIPSGVNQYIGDKNGRTIVWMNNINSITKFGDARDSFNIYVMEVMTTEQKVFDAIYLLIPIIMVGLFLFWFYHERNRGIA